MNDYSSRRRNCVLSGCGIGSDRRRDSASSLARLKDMGVEPGLLATSINCIVARRLARRLCVACREAYEPAEADLVDLAGHELVAPLYRARGCPRCAGTGFAGRVALYEVLPVIGPIRRLIEASTEEIFAAAVEMGCERCARTGSGSASPASRHWTRSAASPATGSVSRAA